jgi:hypothetical protein
MSKDTNLEIKSEGFYDKANDVRYLTFDEYYAKIENDVNQETDEDKAYTVLVDGEACYSYSSLKGLYLKYSELEETFEDWVEKQEYETYESIESYLSGLSEEDFVARHMCEEQPIGFVTCIDEKMTDAYADYKRGYEEWLYIFEEDYSETGRKRPRKSAERKFFGVSICKYNWGDTGEYTGFQPYKLETRRVTIEEWKKV